MVTPDCANGRQIVLLKAGKLANGVTNSGPGFSIILDSFTDFLSSETDVLSARRQVMYVPGQNNERGT